MKLVLPDACWRPELVSGALFLYFSDEPIGFTLHPSVSSFLTGVDPFGFFRLVEERQPPWTGEFFKFVGLWTTYRAGLEHTGALLEPLRGTAFKTVWLSYPRGTNAWDAAMELLAASPLPEADVSQMVDPYSASDELFSHLFFEKYLELYFPGRSAEEMFELGKVMAGASGGVAGGHVDWAPLYEYCSVLFSSRSLKQLLTTAYMFRIPLIQHSGARLLSNERLVPFLASLPVGAPDRRGSTRTDDLLDVAAWEFFRQLVSPVLDPIDETRVNVVSGLLRRRAGEVQRLKARCLRLAAELGQEGVELRTLQSTIRTHIRAKVEKDVQTALELDKQAVEDLLSAVFSDEKAWLGIAALLYSLVNGGPILSAGSAIYALANMGSKAVGAAAKRRERLKASDFALLYRKRGRKTNNHMVEVGILKSLWRKSQEDRWSIHDVKGLTLKPRAGFDSEFFLYESQVELMTSRPATRSVHELFTSFGTTDFLMKQSILPVVAWVEGEPSIRCIGTAFVISCTGYLMTACHVLLDPQERKYARVVKDGDVTRFLDGTRMGVLIPINPAFGYTGSLFFPFERCWYWGKWKDSPLLHEDETFDILTDIAVCKIALMPDGTGHQPLNLSLNRFLKGERTFAIGYAEMNDIPVEREAGRLKVPDFEQDLFVSVGEVMDLFPDNHQRKDVPTPGPCFDFRAKVPGKMSGGPILGGDGSVVRGIISRSFSGEKHAYGAMLGPVIHLPLAEGMTLAQLMSSGNEGIARIQGAGL